MSALPIEEFRKDYDWEEAVGFAPFSMEDVAEVLSADAGENDGQSWVAVVRLNDGRFGLLDAWCDYTGWDCQSGGEGEVADTLEELRRWKMTSTQRRRTNLELPDLDTIPNKPV